VPLASMAAAVTRCSRPSVRITCGAGHPLVRKHSNLIQTGPLNHPLLLGAGLVVALTIGCAVTAIADVMTVTAIKMQRAAPLVLEII
jgi:hypothetical protein